MKTYFEDKIVYYFKNLF